MKMFPLTSNVCATLLLVRTNRAKSYRERRKLAIAAREGSIDSSGKYREKNRDGIRARSET